MDVLGRLRPSLLQMLRKCPITHEHEIEEILIDFCESCQVKEMDRVQSMNEFYKIIMRLNGRLRASVPDPKNVEIVLIGIDGDPEAWDECLSVFAANEDSENLIREYAARQDSFYRTCYGNLHENPHIYFLDQPFSKEKSDGPIETTRLFQDVCALAVDGESRKESLLEAITECVRLRRIFENNADSVRGSLPWNRQTHVRFSIGENWYEALRSMQFSEKGDITVATAQLKRLLLETRRISYAISIRHGGEWPREDWQLQ